VKGLAAFAMKGLWQASLVVASFACLSFAVPLVGFLSSAFFALVVLRQGTEVASVVLAVSGALVALFGVIILGEFWMPLIYAGTLWIPVGIAAWVLRVWRSLGFSLEVVTLLTLVAVMAVYGIMGDPPGYWKGKLVLLLQPWLAASPDGFDPEALRDNLQVVSHYATGLVGAGSDLTVFMTLLLARWWQALLFNPGGFRTEFLALRVTPKFAYAATSVLILAWLSPSTRLAELMWNLGLVFFAVFLVVGIAVMHELLSRRSGRGFWLTGAYLLLFIVPQATLPLAVMGLTDAWMDWRGRKATNSGD
jgi:hypothetical protein